MKQLVALTREVTPAIVRCELTHQRRAPIDVARARAQHDAYERALAGLGCRVERLPADPNLPDAVFIEDVAVVLDEVAIVARPGAESRRAEVPVVAETLARYRPVVRIEPPGTMDGGDVLVVGHRVFVGLSSRTNASAVEQLRALIAPHGYAVEAVRVEGCLHLKSAVTALDDQTLLANPTWLPARVFKAEEIIEIDRSEPYGANAVRVGAALVYPRNFPRTCRRLEARGFDVRTVDVRELQKAEGAVTCCSVIFELSAQVAGPWDRQ